MQGNWSSFVREFRQDRGWRVVLASGIGYGMGLTVLPFYTLGAFVRPLEAEFGWARSEVQACLAFLVAATLVGAWGIGWLTDRYGVRRVALGSQTGLAIGLAVLGLVQAELWTWYAAWFCMSLMGLGTSPITWTRGIAGWFDDGRGFALALALCGSGIVAFVAPPSTALLIDAIGWRFTYFVLAAAVLIVSVSATLWIMPKSAVRKRGAHATGAAPQPLAGLTVKEALKSYRFWLLAASALLLGFAISGIIPNLVPMMVDRGVAPATAATLLGVLGVSIIVGRLAAGFALDRLWAPIVACVMLPLPAISCLLLALGTTDYPVAAVAVVFLGFSTGAEFDLVPYIVTRYFGMRRYGQIYALQWVGWTASSGIAPAIFGYAFDLWGNYAPALYAGMVCFLVAPLLLLAMGRYPRFEARASTP